MQESRAAGLCLRLRDYRRRPAGAAPRQRPRDDRLAPSLCRGVNPSRYGLRRLARRHRRSAAAGAGRDNRLAPTRLRTRHRGARRRRAGSSRSTRGMGARAVGASRHPGLAPWTPERERRGLFSSSDPERDGARAPPCRALPVGARRAVRGRPQRAGHRRAARLCAAASTMREHYLPRLYREVVHGAAAEAPGELRRSHRSGPR